MLRTNRSVSALRLRFINTNLLMMAGRGNVLVCAFVASGLQGQDVWNEALRGAAGN